MCVLEITIVGIAGVNVENSLVLYIHFFLYPHFHQQINVNHINSIHSFAFIDQLVYFDEIMSQIQRHSLSFENESLIRNNMQWMICMLVFNWGIVMISAKEYTAIELNRIRIRNLYRNNLLTRPSTKSNQTIVAIGLGIIEHKSLL
jgi:hypothetical protein